MSTSHGSASHEPHNSDPNSGDSGWAPPPGWAAAERPVAAAPPAPKQPAAGGTSIIPLRPFGAGEVLDGAITLLRTSPGRLLGTAALLAAIVNVGMFAANWALGALPTLDFEQAVREAEQQQQTRAEAIQIIVALTGAVAQISFVLLLTGMVASTVAAAILGAPRDSPRLPWRLLPLIGFELLYLLALFVVWALAIGPLVGLVVAGAGGFAVVLGLVLVPLALVASIYAAVVTTIVPPVIVLERAGPWRATMRAVGLLKGLWWRTFGIVVLLYIVTLLIQSAAAVPLQFAAVAIGTLANNNLLANAVNSLGALLASIVAWPFAAAASVLVYLDVRFRREGFDLRLQDAIADGGTDNDVWLQPAGDPAAGQDPPVHGYAAPFPRPPYPSQPYPAQPYAAQPYPAQPYAAQPYPAQPYGQPQPNPAQQPYGQPQPQPPYGGQPYPAQPYPPQQPYGDTPYPPPPPGS